MRRTVSTLALAVLALGCGDVTAPGLVALTGHWVSGPEVYPDGTSHDWELHVDPLGRVQSRLTMRGLSLYPDGIRAVQTLYGRITVKGDEVVLLPDSLVTNDRFYGLNHHQVQTTGIYWWLTESPVRFERYDNRIVFHFLTYPFDAPVPTTAEYRGLGCVSWETFRRTGHCW
jgi:hypothetical protein